MVYDTRRAKARHAPNDLHRKQHYIFMDRNQITCEICPNPRNGPSKFCSREHGKISSDMYSGETLQEYEIRKAAYWKSRKERGTINQQDDRNNTNNQTAHHTRRARTRSNFPGGKTNENDTRSANET